jgi:hypothetical protein
MLETAQKAVLAQRAERAQALAAGRVPRIVVDTGLFGGPWKTWFFESITDQYTAPE